MKEAQFDFCYRFKTVQDPFRTRGTERRAFEFAYLILFENQRYDYVPRANICERKDKINRKLTLNAQSMRKDASIKILNVT